MHLAVATSETQSANTHKLVLVSILANEEARANLGDYPWNPTTWHGPFLRAEASNPSMEVQRLLCSMVC